MSEQQIERLSALLHRVQQNRQKPRAGGRAAPARVAVAQPTAAKAVAAAPREVESPRPRRSTPPMVHEPAPLPPMASMPAEPPPPPPRRPGPAARPSPMERAVANEIEREPREREAPAAVMRQPLPAPTPMLDPEEIVPRVIEPDPPRPSARPIAQLVSKHAPPVDATFGAMLKRSLSLRPH